MTEASVGSDQGPVPETTLPPSWLGAARTGTGHFAFEEDTRPWNWLELDRKAGSVLWRLLIDFVEFFNHRYGERPELRIPPCWAEHGPVVEEVTTLWWTRWQAFESAHASIGGAQYWHTYTVPGFFDRIGRWIGTDRLERCRQGLHEDRGEPYAGSEGEWTRRVERIALADTSLRALHHTTRSSNDQRTSGEQQLPIPFLDRA